MSRVFLDSSVLFSAAYSRHGHAYDLLLMGVRGEITLLASQLVLNETRRNLADHAPDKLDLLNLALEQIPFELVRPTRREVAAAAKRVALKDAPIVAAARKAKVDFLVTLDKKHLLGRPALEAFARAAIVTPKDAVAQLSGRG